MADAPALSRITTVPQLDHLMAESECPVWLFKHSLICPTSAAAWRQFQAFAARRSDRALVAVVEIQNARELSKAVADRTGVRHESPQVLLLRKGRPLWHASHWQITESALEKAASVHEVAPRSVAESETVG